VGGVACEAGREEVSVSLPLTRAAQPSEQSEETDETSRVYGEMVSRILRQPVIIENRPGGSGMLAIQAVKSAPPDGYTIMLGSNSPMAVNPVAMKDLPYDPFKDFRPVHAILVGPAAFVVRAESPPTSR
jgi:tripartite-type tricarboxylate transporter receptor subunit TctC